MKVMGSLLLFGMNEKFTVYEAFPALSLGLLVAVAIAVIGGIVFLFKSGSTSGTLRTVAAMLLALALVCLVITLLMMQQYSPWPLPVYTAVLVLIAVILFMKARR